MQKVRAPAAAGESRGAAAGTRLLRGARRELGIGFRTFLRAWMLLALAMLLWGIAASPDHFRGVGDFVLTIVLGFVMFLFYMFWPAVVIALVRSAYRLVGAAAFVPLPIVLLGIAAAFFIGGDFLSARTQELFRALAGSGSCGGHAGGPAVVLALACLAFATLTKPAALWALAKLVASVVGLFVLGALPGLVLWVVLIARALLRRARRGEAAVAQSASRAPMLGGSE
jgi:hypothetical protein